MVPIVLGGDDTCCDRAGFEGDGANTTVMLCLAESVTL